MDNRWDIRGLSAAALIVGNLVPLAGVLFWGWDVAAIVILYWSENLVVGAFTIVKLIHHSPLGGLFSSAFFTVHYGGFCGVHGFFVLALTGHEIGDPVGGEPWPLWLVFVQILLNVCRQVLELAPGEWLIAFGALFISHGISLVANYFGRREFEGTTTQRLMQAPYKRIVLLHVAIIAGGFAVMALGSPMALLVILVMLKTGVDLFFHAREHASGGDDAQSRSSRYADHRSNAASISEVRS
jgi:hypothetical protein